jgi:hypothetical protein
VKPGKPLIVLVTSAQAPNDEWSNDFGFSAEQVAAFIQQGTCDFSTPQCLQERLGLLQECDVLVIDGKRLVNTFVKDALNSVAWSELGRELTLRIHLRGSVLDHNWRESLELNQRPNLAALANHARVYGLGESPSSDHPVLRFATSIASALTNANRWSEYENALSLLRVFFLAPHTRISILKHRIAHLLLPIDLDLQGLNETSFRDDYWDEVVRAWQNDAVAGHQTGSEEQSGEIPDSKAVAALNAVREHVYGSEGESTVTANDDNVEKAITQATVRLANDVRQGIDGAWKATQALLPRNGLPSIPETIEVLKALGRRDGRDYLRTALADGTRPSDKFRDWFRELNEALERLRDVLAFNDS